MEATQIRDAIPFLPTVPSERYAAQIAMARAMEVGRIDALDPFVTRDWRRYLNENELVAQGEGNTARPDVTDEASELPPTDYASIWK